jgi:hypothetical protein
MRKSHEVSLIISWKTVIIIVTTVMTSHLHNVATLEGNGQQKCVLTEKEKT